MIGSPQRSGRLWMVSFVALAAIWGCSFLFIKVIVDGGVHPFHLAWSRCALGAAALLIALAVMRTGLPRDRVVWVNGALSALLFNTIPFVLFGFGEQRISSVLAGLWNAVTPLPTLLVALAILPSEKPTRRKLIGLLAGFCGVLVVLGPWRGIGGPELWGNLACLGAAISYGLAYGHLRLWTEGRTESGVALAAVQLIMATGQLTVLSLFAPLPDHALGGEVIWSMLGLGILGSGLAYVLNQQVVSAAGATTGSTVTYLIPLFSTGVGILVLNEALTWNEPLGAVIVLAAVAASRRRVAEH